MVVDESVPYSRWKLGGYKKGEENKEPSTRLPTNMELFWRADADSQAGPSRLVLDGKNDADVAKYFFVYENIVMRSKSDEDKAGELLCYLQGDAFEFYYSSTAVGVVYDTYSRNGKLTDDAGDYQAVKKAMINRFESVTGPVEHIRRAVSGRLHQSDLLGSLNEIDRCFDKAAYDAEAKLGLLRNAVMEHADVAQFVLYRAPGTYEELRKAIKDFDGGRKAFAAVQSLSQPQQMVPKSILQRPDRLQRSNKVEEKVDMLADNLAELSLLMKKKNADQSYLDTRTCSFCKDVGHVATRCLSNPYRTTRCPSWETWSRRRKLLVKGKGSSAQQWDPDQVCSRS